VLSPDAAGRYALGARDLAAVRLAARPVIVLAGCEAAATGQDLETTWGLAEAFLAAGASAVIASPATIGDADAAALFAAVRTRIIAGTAPAIALRDVRRGWPVRSHWIDRLVVFQ
jgi:CHAT domain-containing protein